MKLYAGIDLHSNNSLIVIIDTEGNQVYQKRLDNELNVILKVLDTYKSQLTAIAIESTFNWYWLVDGLVNEGYKVHLANTAAIQRVMPGYVHRLTPLITFKTAQSINSSNVKNAIIDVTSRKNH